jgi:anti-sigma factor RsiW
MGRPRSQFVRPGDEEATTQVSDGDVLSASTEPKARRRWFRRHETTALAYLARVGRIFEELDARATEMTTEMKALRAELRDR